MEDKRLTDYQHSAKVSKVLQKYWDLKENDNKILKEAEKFKAHREKFFKLFSIVDLYTMQHALEVEYGVYDELAEKLQNYLDELKYDNEEKYEIEKITEEEFWKNV